jgi:hypothetical protein
VASLLPLQNFYSILIHLLEAMAAQFCLQSIFFHGCKVLSHAVNLRHGTDGFTSPPKEGVLRILPPLTSIDLGRV